MEQFRGRKSELEKLKWKKFDQMDSLERSQTDFLPLIKTKNQRLVRGGIFLHGV